MVKIRLKRLGRKNRPFYRIVVADSRTPRDGRSIEEIGTYNPLTDPRTITLDLDRVDYWLKNGAQPTDTVKSIINEQREKQAQQAEEDINNDIGTSADSAEDLAYDMVDEADNLIPEGE